MELKDILLIAVSLIFGLVSYAWKREIAIISSENDEIKNMVKEREDRNYTSHKEIWDEQNKLRERVATVEAVQERCGTCRGDK